MSGTAVNDIMDKAIRKENEALDQTIENIPDVDEDKLREVNLAHLKHPWLE